MIDNLIPNFPKEKRGKAKQVLHRLVAETKVTFCCRHERLIVSKNSGKNKTDFASST